MNSLSQETVTVYLYVFCLFVLLFSNGFSHSLTNGCNPEFQSATGNSKVTLDATSRFCLKTTTTKVAFLRNRC